nr:TonB-dependent receptor [Gemmatimonadota bacterium]
PVPVSAADLARVEELLRPYGLVSGSGGPVENGNPLRSLFARIDVALPEWSSRAVLWVNDTRARNLNFSRGAARDSFPLSTHAATQATSVGNASLQLHTALRRAGGGHNELLVSYRSAGTQMRSDVQQPIVRVRVPGTTGGAVTLIAGTPQQAQGLILGGRSINLRDALTLPLGASHAATLGLEAELFQADRSGVPNSYGTWEFSSLDSLALGVAERFELAQNFGSANVPVSGAHYAVYAGDQWRAAERLSLTLGVRAEVLAIGGRAPYNPVVDTIFARRTDEMPMRRLHLSPRLGFTWDPFGMGREQLRGGVGVFTGRPPVAWLHSTLYSYGAGIGRLSCGRRPTDLGPPPLFAPDHRAPPTECANGAGLHTAPRGDVDLLDGQLRMAQTLRGVLAYDRRLPWDLFGTLEALVTRNLSDFAFVNLNLGGPQAVDRYGRVLYGSIEPTGVARPALRSNFSEVIELRNTSRNHAYQLSARLEKRFSEGAAATAHYTFSRVRDVQTPLRVYAGGLVNWASRALSGRHDDLSPGTSLNDIPHRVVLAGTKRAPWRRWPTELSFSYLGESGSPFTYLARGAGGRGDLNADGSNANDPIYVPRSAFDASELRFATFTRQVRVAGGGTRADTVTTALQAEAFERLVERTPCLRRQRGQILERNSCREPWSHTTAASLRQGIPIAGRTLEAQLEVHNLLNLLNQEWGHYRVAAPALLEHVGQTAGPPGAAQPIFRFNPTAPQWTTLPSESAFQLQLALRYRF